MNGIQENTMLEFVPVAIAPTGISQKEKNRIRYLRYKELHPERIVESRRNWKQRNIKKTREDTKKWRENHKKEVYKRIEEYREENKDFWSAIRAVEYAVRTGKVIKPPTCSKCGKECLSKNMHGHHDDYSKQLEVRWLCRKCHYYQHHQ